MHVYYITTKLDVMTYCVEAVEIRLTHGKALPSVMGELASKLINESLLVASVFSKFISVVIQ